MTKFELARTAGRWGLRSRTYVALAILFVTAWPTNADLFHDAFAVRGPRLDAEGEVSSRCGHLPSAPVVAAYGKQNRIQQRLRQAPALFVQAPATKIVNG